VASYENYAVFSVSQFQYIILAIVFSKGYPYRRSMVYNIPLMVTILVLTGFSVYLVLDPAKVLIYEFIIGFHLFLPPVEEFWFRLLLLGLAAANLFISLFCESVLCDRCLKQKVDTIKRDVKKHEKLEKELNQRKDWPNLAPEQDSAMVSPNKNSSAGSRDHQVIITDQGVSDANDALNSLFSTPASICHESAAVILNPPPYSPKRQQLLQQQQLANNSLPGMGAGAALNQYRSSSTTAESTPMHMNNKNNSNFDSALSTPVRNGSELASPTALVSSGAKAASLLGGLEASDSSSECNSKFVSCNSVLIENEIPQLASAEGTANGGAVAGYKPVAPGGEAAASTTNGYNHLVTEPGSKKTCSNAPIPYR
jgi:hypothetical protein